MVLKDSQGYLVLSEDERATDKSTDSNILDQYSKGLAKVFQNIIQNFTYQATVQFLKEFLIIPFISGIVAASSEIIHARYFRRRISISKKQN